MARPYREAFMLPSFRQRLVMAVATVIGAALWLSVAGVLQASDGSSGTTLRSDHVGLSQTLPAVMVVAAGVAALGLVVSAAGNPMSGVFCMATSLTILAIRGGSMAGWLRRSDLPGDYGALMTETLIWFAGMISFVWVIQCFRTSLRSRLPVAIQAEYFDATAGLGEPEPSPDDELGSPKPKSRSLSKVLVHGSYVQIYMHLMQKFPQLRLGLLQPIAATLITSVCASAVGYFLIRNSDISQVICSLILAFMVGGSTAGVIFPSRLYVGVLTSPFVVALGAYGYTLLQFDSSHAFLKSLFGQELIGMTMALPIHYASAGVLGCTLGIGFSQMMLASKAETAESA